MKLTTTISTYLFSASLAFGQTVYQLPVKDRQMQAVTCQYIKATSFHVTKPLRELGSTELLTAPYKPNIGDDREGNVSPGANMKYPSSPDTVVQDRIGSAVLDTPLVNFEGGNWFYRPDANGAAGPDHYVQGVNLCNYNIYNKAGHLLLSTDMNTLGGNCSDDPIVMYDKFADRWVVTAVTYGYSNLSIAVSVTGDPTGAYYVWTYNFGVMPDFPKYAIWTDGYYANYRNISNDTVGVGVLERNRMLKGSPSAGIILAKYPTNNRIVDPHSQLPGSPRLISCDGALPPFGSPEYMMYYTNTNMGDPGNRIMIYQLQTDTTNKTCHITIADSLLTSPFNGYFNGYHFGGNIMEPGDTTSVWSLEGFFAIKAPYIRFTGYNSVVLSHTVNLGDSIAGIRWYELRQNDTTKKWKIYQQSTYGPNDSTSRWNSGIAMDMNGDISIAYNVTNSKNLYPGIRYTGRLSSDPLNKMTFTEQTAIKGKANFGTQWGDISASWLDPDGLTFWHTNQYIIDTTGQVANVRIFAYRLSSGLNGVQPLPVSQSAILKVYRADQNFLNVELSGITNNDKVVVDLFDINGRLLNSSWHTPESTLLKTKIGVGNLAKGAYLVRVGNADFQRVAKVILN